MDEQILTPDSESAPETAELPETEDPCEENAEEPCTSEDEEAEIKPTLDSELEEIRREFPEIVEAMAAADAERYSELRAMGLTPREAYLASSTPKRPSGGRSHLRDSLPRSAKSPESNMTRRELSAARELFDGLDDGEIQRLYKKVTK